jgi:hypothetical protein
MRVRTIRKHINRHGPVPIKQHGRKYEVSDRDGRNLIAAGLVEEDRPAAKLGGDEG